jgi:anti-sigma regulatory factor (Ser/Thr protein kinase)
MEALLTDGWLDGLDAVPTIDDASAALARELTRARATEAGLDREATERVVIAASELVHNQLRHARRGQFGVRVVERSGVSGVELVAADLGAGIADPRTALEGPGPSARSLGTGLASARRMVHEMDIDVRWGEGSAIRARAFAAQLPRRREVGILGRCIADERVSGDHAVFFRHGDTLVCAVIDGIGHGPLARDASMRAASVLLLSRSASLGGAASLVEACDAPLVDTRGAVMAVARFDEAKGTIDHASVGNVTARIEGFQRVRSFTSTASTLGRRGSLARAAAETDVLTPEEALVMFTDGLVVRTAWVGRDLLREHPIVIAQHLLKTCARATDDALVLVAR